MITGSDIKAVQMPKPWKHFARSGIGLSVVELSRCRMAEVISSPAIRKALTRGDTALAQRMLGRPVTQAMKDIFFSINRETEKVEEGFA